MLRRNLLLSFNVNQAFKFRVSIFSVIFLAYEVFGKFTKFVCFPIQPNKRFDAM